MLLLPTLFPKNKIMTHDILNNFTTILNNYLLLPQQTSYPKQLHYGHVLITTTYAELYNYTIYNIYYI